MNKNVTGNQIYRLPAAWEPQDAMLLVWPGEQAIAVSEDIVELYEALVAVLIDYADVILVAPINQFDEIKERLVLMEVPIEYVYFYDASATDTKLSSINVRDYGPFIIESENEFILAANQNSFVDSLYKQQAFPCVVLDDQAVSLSWSGIESDGGENLLVNVKKLYEKNSEFSADHIDEFFQNNIANNNIIRIESQFAELDIIRLCPGNKLIYLDCDEKNSLYYEPVQNLKNSLIEQMSLSEKKLELIPLPWGGVLTNDDGIEYSANYSQFVVINEAVLVPLFDLPSDEDAMEIISQVFPGFDILGFPSSSLAVLNTSLLRVTQSIPEGVLEPLS
jgi:agmatine deiminase